MTTKTPPEQTITVLAPGLQKFVVDIVELVEDGWQLDEENMPTTIGFMYEAHLWRNPTEAQRQAGPKLSRPEILAKAREAKAAKALERAQAAGEEPADESPY